MTDNKDNSIPTLPVDYNFYMVAYGWECPRCHKINNPKLDQCLCKPSDKPTIQIDINAHADNVNWNGLMGPWFEKQ